MSKAHDRAVHEMCKVERALLLAEIDQLRESLRQLEAERDQWQRLANQ